MEAAAAARAARRAKERAERVGRHSRRGAQAQLSQLRVAEGKGAGKDGGVDAADAAAKKEGVASVFAKKKRRG